MEEDGGTELRVPLLLPRHFFFFEISSSPMRLGDGGRVALVLVGQSCCLGIQVPPGAFW